MPKTTKNYTNLDTLPQSLHMEQAIIDISRSLNQFLNNKTPSEFGLYVVQISNLPNLLHNFKDEEVYHHITKLMHFLLNHFNGTEDKDLLIKPCGLHNIMICKKVQNVEQMLKKVERLFSSFQKYAMEQNWSLHFVLNCGISHLEHSEDAATAWEKAMIALAESVNKKTGYNMRIYDPDAHEFIKYRNNIMMAAYFRNAFASQHLDLAYQPIFCVKSKKITLYECLMRVTTEEGDFLSAGPFIRIAERFGFINAVDNFALDNVINNLTKYPMLKLAMNVSNLTALSHIWQKRAKKLITPDIASRLVIEVTETGDMNDLGTMEEFANFIRSLGCKVSVDDFGVGNTSFAQLKLMNPNIIKIDGRFIRDIDTNPQSAHFASAIITLAKNIGAKTVAEYVETENIAQIVTALGVDFLQGNYISQALNYKPWAL